MHGVSLWIRESIFLDTFTHFICSSYTIFLQEAMASALQRPLRSVFVWELKLVLKLLAIRCTLPGKMRLVNASTDT